MTTAQLRALIKEKLRVRRAARAPVSPPPRYDEVYERGVEWLDSDPVYCRPGWRTKKSY